MLDSLTARQSQRVHSGSGLLRFWQPAMQQTLFRSLVKAFSYPGQSIELADTESFVAVLATLVDAETMLADPDQLLSNLTKTRLNAAVVDPEQASFIIARGDIKPRFTPQLGTLESPESGATVVVLVDSFTDGDRWRLSGPGIERPRHIDVAGLDVSWLSARNSWCIGFPLGIDMILTDHQRCLALPRTTLIVDSGAN